MNKNITALILIVLAIGIYFTYTSGRIAELKTVQLVNDQYQTAINNASQLIKQRDKVVKDSANIADQDNARLNKILPDNVDNVRLIIDVKDSIAANHHLSLKNIRTSSPTDDIGTTAPVASTPGTLGTKGIPAVPSSYGTVTLSFSVSTDYQTFIDFMKDLESSLRVMDISRLSVTANTEKNTYDFNVEVKTYWLKQ